MLRNASDLDVPAETITTQSSHDTEVKGITDKVTVNTSVPLQYPYVNLSRDISLPESSWTMLRNILVDAPTGFHAVCMDTHQSLGYLPDTSIPMFLKILNLPNDTIIGYFSPDKPLKVSDLWAFS